MRQHQPRSDGLRPCGRHPLQGCTCHISVCIVQTSVCSVQLGGSGVMVQPMTYIFDEEPARWRTIVEEVGLPQSVTASVG